MAVLFGVAERFLLLIPRCSPSPLCVYDPPFTTGHDITSSLEPPNIDTSILEEYISKEDDSTDMSVGTPNQQVSKQHASVESYHVVTKEFVFSDKANPFFFFSTFLPAVSLRSTAPQDQITHLPSQDCRPLGGWCVV